MAEDINQNLHNERRVYNKAELNINNTTSNPFILFDEWYNEAAALKTFEANAMSLSTVDLDGAPHSRIVLLKSYSEKGLVFYTNYNSSKGNNLKHNAKVALLFFYEKLERQIRIQGTVERLSDEENDAYFYSRPIESQLGAIASPQSSVIGAKAELEAKYKELVAENKKPQRPKHWGGYLVKVNYFEFWQGRPSRLHDRICYQLDAHSNNWRKFILAP